MTLFGNGNASPLTVKNTAIAGTPTFFEVAANGTTIIDTDQIATDALLINGGHMGGCFTVKGNGEAYFGGNGVFNSEPTLYVSASKTNNTNVITGRVGVGTAVPGGSFESVMRLSSVPAILASNYSPDIDADVLQVYDVNSAKINFKVKANGYIYARRIEVSMNGFPDYVFSKNYKLMSIKELQEYIAINNHLPNMPTAQEVEQNGADLGEIQRLSVEKTEESFLYIIELNKKLEMLMKENEEIKKQLAELQKK